MWAGNYWTSLYLYGSIVREGGERKGGREGGRDTFIVPSSEPVARYWTPLRLGQHEFTKEVCPFSFLTLTPTSQSQTAAVLSVEAENRRLCVCV